MGASAKRGAHGQNVRRVGSTCARAQHAQAHAAQRCIEACRVLCRERRYAEAARSYVEAFEALRLPSTARAM